MATKTRAGLALRCPFCMAEDQALRVDLHELGEVECEGCGESFAPAEAAARLADQARRWEAVTRWLEAAGTIVV